MYKYYSDFRKLKVIFVVDDPLKTAIVYLLILTLEIFESSIFGSSKGIKV